MTTTHQLKVVGPESLDFEAYTSFQKAAVQDLLEAYGAEGLHLKASYFQWKYNPPAGSGKVALISDGSEILSANSMIPYSFCTPLGTRLGWQSGDTATLMQARGQGLFTRCISALASTIPNDQLFFGFPNHNSMKGFGKLGWTVWRDVDCWIRPIVLGPASGRTDPRISLVERFGSHQDTFNERIGQTGLSFLDRNSAYLNWRYHDHPIFEYRSYAILEDDIQRGFAVVRKAKIGRLTYLILMELWGLEPSDEVALLRHCVALASESGLHHVALLDTAGTSWSKLACGFLPVPRRAMPKKQALMGQLIGRPLAPLHGLRWRSQFGDWDSF